MAANRQFPTSGTGPEYMAKMAEEGTALYNAACLPLTVTGGTADDPVCTCAPPLTAGVLAGMSFWWTATADNGGPMTMAIDGGAAIAIKDDGFEDLAGGTIKAGQRYLLTASDGVLVAMSTVNIQKVNDFQKFTASGTWYKPPGTPADALIYVEVWGAGGAGGATSGRGAGGGGGYVTLKMRAGDVTASVAITVGAGGTPGNAGGNSSFGAYAVAYGGGSSTDVSGGGGGGPFTKGGNGSGSVGTAGLLAGRGGGSGSNGEDGYSGGGGGGGQGASGGKSLYGGGGGGSSAGAGGASTFGGNGGAGGAAGQPPGGGGGTLANGGRGEVRIHVIG